MALLVRIYMFSQYLKFLAPCKIILTNLQPLQLSGPARMCLVWGTPGPPSLCSSSAPTIASEYSLCRESQNTTVYNHFSFCSPAKLLSACRALGHSSLHPLQPQLSCHMSMHGQPMDPQPSAGRAPVSQQVTKHTQSL